MKCWNNEMKAANITELFVDDGRCNDVATLDLSNYTELRSITIGDKSFNSLKTMNLTGLSKLVNISIGDSSFSKVTTLDMTGLNDLQSISIGDNSFPWVTILDLTSLNELQSISIGDECFSNVYKLRIEGLNQLENVTIGINSFTQYKNSHHPEYSHASRYFFLRNCPLLKEVRIGRYSFSDYTYSYVENLESIELIKYGDVSEISYNFYQALYASFESD